MALESKVHELNAVISEQADKIDELQALVVDMYRWFESDYPKRVVDGFTSRMRELGIEVK